MGPLTPLADVCVSPLTPLADVCVGPLALLFKLRCEGPLALLFKLRYEGSLALACHCTIVLVIYNMERYSSTYTYISTTIVSS